MTGPRISIALLISLAAMPTLARAADVVVVCPEQLCPALQPWLDHRQGEGLNVEVIRSERNAEALRSSIRRVADDKTLYIVLIGDAPAFGTACDATRQTPILYRPTKVTAAWGSTPTLSSDLFYGDFDTDDVPDAVVGRLPVDNADQLKRLVDRILAYETSDDFGQWRSHVQLVGGVGGFGAIADAAIESVTRTLVTGVLPAATRTSVSYASPGHLFFPTGSSFTDAIVANYARGSRFWVYAGHGQVTTLDRVPQTSSGVPVLDRQSVKLLDRPAGGSPIAVLLACYTGALDASEDSIAEEMLLCDGGPIAVIAGSRVTMPYGNTTAAVGLINAVFAKQLPRLGDAWLSALAEMHGEDATDTSTTRKMIDTLAAMVSPAGSNLVDERREHMMLYNLIGDPTLRLIHPQPIVLELPASHASGEVVEVNVTCPVNGDMTLSCDRPLGAVTAGDPNHTTIASLTTQVVAGQTQRPRFELPTQLHGPIIVRAFVTGKNAWASGAATTILREPSLSNRP